MCTRDYCIAVKVCLPTDLTEVGRGLLVTAGHVPQQASQLHEARLTELTAEGSLAGLGVAVRVQADLGAAVCRKGGPGRASLLCACSSVC